MDIFNRKKLADAEAEIRWWKELNHQQYDELQAISDKLRTAENKIIKYKQTHNEDTELIDKLKRDNDALNTSCQVLTDRLKSNKSMPSAYDKEDFQQDREIDDEIKEIDNVENKSKTKSAPYTIRKEVVDELKKAIFRSKAVKIGFLTIFNDLLYKNRDELTKIMENILSLISEGHNEINWTDIQINLSELAKPYIEEIGK